MKTQTLIIFLSSFIVSLTTIFFYIRLRWKKRKKRLEFFTLLVKKIRAANDQLKIYQSFNHGYFCNYDCVYWVLKNKDYYEGLLVNRFDDLNLHIEWVKEINYFMENYSKIDEVRELFNKKFVEFELQNYSDFFDDVEGRKLDIQQREAIVINEDRNLIIAGAGSGKTSTIVGKVKYLLDRYDISPEKILLISFTRKAVDSLSDRIKIEEINTMTFNKLGKVIIEQVENQKASVYDALQFEHFIDKGLSILLEKDNYLRNLINHFVDYEKEPKSAFDFNSQKEYFQFLKDFDCKPYKTVEILVKGKITLARETVLSVEECKIANFLFLNGIEYKYQEKYEYNEINGEKFVYKPDFTIYHNGEKYYLEHFGIDREGNVPNWFNGKNNKSAKESYNERIIWKRRVHKHFNTTLIETYSYEMQENTLLTGLEKKLKKIGVNFIRKSPEEIWKLINDSDPYGKKMLVNLISTFIVQLKSNEKSIRDIERLNEKTNNTFYKLRTENLLNIINPIFEAYQSMLKETGEIDFTDMIIKSTKYVKSKQYSNDFQYIIIDEFQDLSKDRYLLISELLKSNPSCKLFCVGDDWQSIYRFAGSDISLFKKFEDYFGVTKKSKIESTYRFGGELIKYSSDFILKNPIQTPKLLKNPGNLETNIKTIYSKDKYEDGDANALILVIEDLIAQGIDIDTANILMLGRYNFDINRVCTNTRKFIAKSSPNGEMFVELNHLILKDGKPISKIKIPFLSVHKAKGLEADIVIVINCNSGKYGFPSGVSDDNILSFLLTEEDQFEHGEERRLFYVAMTRARKHLYFIAEESIKSKFISEFEELNPTQSNNKYCNDCEDNTMVYRGERTSKNGNNYKWWSCLNYKLGCENIEREYIK